MSIASQWRRITAKPARELAARAADVVRGRIERRQYLAGRLSPGNRLATALGTRAVDADALLAARRAGRCPFFPSLLQRDQIRQVMSARYPGELASMREWTAQAMAHEFAFFGQTHKYGDTVDWHADPVSRTAWPRVFCGDVYTAAGSRCGDVKDVCELSRQQFVIDLGKSYFLDGNGPAAAQARLLVGSWLRDNPYAEGVNWASPLEPAYRTFSWLWAYYFMLDDPRFAAEDHAAWMEGFLDNGRFLHRHLELFASPYNHLIGEATALYLLGMLFPEFQDAAAWRERGRTILESRLKDQFYTDGGTVEQATLYHHATLGFYVLAGLVGRANGDALSPAVWTAIERAIEFSMLLVQPDGQLPVIGDTDDARPIQIERKPMFDFRAYQAIGAVLFDRGDFKAVAGRFHEDALWLLGMDGLERFDRLAAALPQRRSVALTASGYFIGRSDWTEAADYVCFDCGEQAGGLRSDDVPSAAHGHADCLSVVAFLRGRPVLVDSGLFTYNGEEAWERHFRETAGHNTARVDGRDQAAHLSKMAWTHVPHARVEYVADLDDACFVGSHDGFVAATGIRHRRYVWYRRDGGYFVLFDDFDGHGAHDIDVAFHLAPGEAALGGGSLRLDDVACLHWAATFPVTASLACGGAGPQAGWIAPSLGIRVAAPVLTLAGRTERSGASLITIFAPPGHVVAATAGDGRVIASVADSGWDDQIEAVPTRLDASPSGPGPGLTITRRRADAIVQRLHVTGANRTERR